METCVQSRPTTPYRSTRSRSYETTYQRQFSSIKKVSNIDEGVPAGQRFIIGHPYQLNDPMGVTSYTVDYLPQDNIQREPIIRPNTPRANRPHTQPQFTHRLHRPVTASTTMSEETKQAFRNQFTSTYRMDYLGAPQGFPLPLAYNQSRSFWRNPVHRPLDTEHRITYQYPLRPTTAPTGRYTYTSRIPANGIIPLTLPMWRQGTSRTAYRTEISEKAPSQLYMKAFVDSLSDHSDS